MKVEQAYDKVHLSHEDIQNALKKMVEQKTGRTVRGDVYVSSDNRGLTEQFMHKVSCGGTCYLEPAAAPLVYANKEVVGSGL